MTKIYLSLCVVVPLLFAMGGCTVSTCKGGECDFDDFGPDEDGGSGEGGMVVGEGGATGGDGGIPDFEIGEAVDLDGDGTDDGQAIDTDGDGQADGVDLDGDDTIDLPLPVKGGLSVVEFCDATLRAREDWQLKLNECCIGVSQAEAKSDEIKAILGLFGPATSDVCVARIQQRVRDGKIIYDGTKAQACADAYTASWPAPPAACPTGEGFGYWSLGGSVGKGAASLEQLDACRLALGDRVATGEECTDHFECKPEERCFTMSVGRSTCQPARAKTNACDTTSDCDTGLTCAGVEAAGGRVCLANNDLKFGGGCRYAVECRQGFYCTQAKTCAAIPDNLPTSSEDCGGPFECAGWCATDTCAPLCAG